MRRAAVLICLGIAVPYLLGCLLAEWEPEKGTSESPAYRIMAGTVFMWAVFQLLAVPMILLQLPFHTLVLSWTTALVLLSLYAAFRCRRRLFRKIPLHAARGPVKKRIVPLLILLCALFLIGIQCGEYALRMHTDDDDSRFIVNAVTAYEHDTMLLENPATGEMMPRPEGELVKDVTSPWSIYIAAVSRMASLHPAIMAHTVLPVWLLLLRWMTVWLIGTLLFADGTPLDDGEDSGVSGEEKRAWFMLFCTAAVMFFGGSVYTAGAFTLVRIWQGKAVAAAVAIPWILCISFLRFEKKASCVLLAVSVTGMCLLSGIGILTAAALTGVFAVWKGITGKSVRTTAACILCAFPAVLYSVIYSMLK